MGVARGLRQALVALGVALAAALVAALVWSAVGDQGFRPALGILLMVIGGLVSLTGGLAVARGGGHDAWAFLGMGPDVEAPGTGEGLTGLGLFLFVSLPLFALGAVLYGSG